MFRLGPYSTLKDRSKQNKNSDPRFGCVSTFTPEQENELEKHCIYLAKMFYGITPLELRKVAYDFAEKNGMKHKFNKNKQIAGKDWFQAYLKRHPNLSIRKPEATSLGRISGFNRESVEKFFTNLNEVLLLYKFKPDRIYNVDETGISTVPTPSKIVGPKGVKQLGKAVSWERREEYNCCVCNQCFWKLYSPNVYFSTRTYVRAVNQKWPSWSNL